MAPTGFPCFADGDVEIRLCTDDDTFVLHSQTLSTHLPWFKASLSKNWNRGCSGAREEGTIKAKYELRFDKDTALGMFSKVGDSTGDTEMLTKQTTELPESATNESSEIFSGRVSSVEAHEAFFGMLYHLAPDFKEAQRFTAIKDLMRLAEIYGGEDHVRVHISYHLLSVQDEVLKSCSTSPVDMIEIAFAARCKWLFQEAAIYIIGGTSAYFNESVDRLKNTGLEDLFVMKRKSFESKLDQIDRALFMHNYATVQAHVDILRFLAPSICRLWLSRKLNIRSGGLGDDFALTYRSLKVQQNRNIGPELMAISEDPGSSIWNRRFGRTRDEVKRAANDCLNELSGPVDEVLVDRRLRRDCTSSEQTLTFMTVEDHEMPWPQPGGVTGQKRKRDT